MGDLPAYFHTLSMAELHWQPLEDVLAEYVRVTRGADAGARVATDPAYKRKMLLECGHVVTQAFDARTVNWFATLAREQFQLDDVWWRYEFAKSRGAIHAHALISSWLHHKRLQKAMDAKAQQAAGQRAGDGVDDGMTAATADAAETAEAKAERLQKEADEAQKRAQAKAIAEFLQYPQREPTRRCEVGEESMECEECEDRPDECEEWPNGLGGLQEALRCVRPNFVSMHPTGADSDAWPAPEGHGEDPPNGVLRASLRWASRRGSSIVKKLHQGLVNRTMLHACSACAFAGPLIFRSSFSRLACSPLLPAACCTSLRLCRDQIPLRRLPALRQAQDSAARSGRQAALRFRSLLQVPLRLRHHQRQMQ